MITLYQFPATWDVTSTSCFCAKVEAFLAWQKIPYQVENTLELKRSPSGKLPYIRDGRVVLSDSDLIISHIAQKHDIDLYKGCSAAEIGTSRAIQYLCEEGLYRAMAYFRFVDDAGWEITREAFFANIPSFLHVVLDYKVRGHLKKQLHAHGLARKDRKAIIDEAIINLQALSDMLGDKTFFAGDGLTLTDLIVYSVVSNFIVAPYDNDISAYARSLPKLQKHTDHVRTLCFPDYKAAA